MEDLLSTLQRCWEKRESAVLATIVETEGSTYRRAGAKSLILSDGKFLGVLSGGCVEQDIFEHARDVIETRESKWIDYDLRQDDAMPWGLGIGCNGAMKILLQLFDPVHQPERAKTMIEILRKPYESAIPFACLTVISSDYSGIPIGTQWIVEETEEWWSREGVDLKPFVPHITQLKEKGKSWIVNQSLLDGKGRLIQLSCFVEIISPVSKAVIFGGGPDAVPLVHQLKFLNWHVSVVDHRPDYANHAHFPEADEIVVVSPGTFPHNMVFDEMTYAVIMTHHYQQDMTFLKNLLSYPLSYIGLLGPRKRTKRLLSDIQKEGVTWTNESLEKLHAPIGMDIGAEGPEAIALSVASEMMCCKNHREGGFLCEKDGPIHERKLNGQSMPPKNIKEFV